MVEISFPLNHLTKVYARPVTLAELQAALPESTAVVHFNTGTWNEPTTAFVLTHDGTSAYVLPPADSLVDPVRRLVLGVQAKRGWLRRVTTARRRD